MTDTAPTTACVYTRRNINGPTLSLLSPENTLTAEAPSYVTSGHVHRSFRQRDLSGDAHRPYTLHVAAARDMVQQEIRFAGPRSPLPPGKYYAVRLPGVGVGYRGTGIAESYVFLHLDDAPASLGDPAFIAAPRGVDHD